MKAERVIIDRFFSEPKPGIPEPRLSPLLEAFTAVAARESDSLKI